MNSPVRSESIAQGATNVSPELLAKRTFFRRKKGCPLSEPGAPKIDYKDVKLLSRFLSERGRLLPSRITGVSAKKQRELKRAVKQARNIALLPFVLQ